VCHSSSLSLSNSIISRYFTSSGVFLSLTSRAKLEPLPSTQLSPRRPLKLLKTPKKTSLSNSRIRPLDVFLAEAVSLQGKPRKPPSRSENHKLFPLCTFPLYIELANFFFRKGKQPRTPTRKGRGKNLVAANHQLEPLKETQQAQVDKCKQEQQQQPHQQSQQIQAAQEPQPGYCELCEKHFNDLDEHLNTPVHNHIVNLTSFWEKVDLAIGLVNMNSDDSIYEHSEGL